MPRRGGDGAAEGRTAKPLHGGLAGRGRPPGGPSWAILSHGPPGGRALPEGAAAKKSLLTQGGAGGMAGRECMGFGISMGWGKGKLGK